MIIWLCLRMGHPKKSSSSGETDDPPPVRMFIRRRWSHWYWPIPIIAVGGSILWKFSDSDSGFWAIPRFYIVLPESLEILLEAVFWTLWLMAGTSSMAGSQHSTARLEQQVCAELPNSCIFWTPTLTIISIVSIVIVIIIMIIISFIFFS